MRKLLLLLCSFVISGSVGFVIGAKAAQRVQKAVHLNSAHGINAANTKFLLKLANGIHAGDPDKVISDIELALSTNRSILRDYESNPRLSEVVRLYQSEEDAADLDGAVEEALESLEAYSAKHRQAFDE
ncbi:MAG: hypothetical protein AAFN78_12405 [Pseudomonadota bacterium]